MKVAVVTMLFPVPSETFASNDARELTARGAEVAVHSLRPTRERADVDALMEQRDLHAVDVTYHRGLRSVGRGALVALGSPLVALDLLAAIVRRCAGTPDHLVKSLVLLPRALEIFAALRAERPDVVHAYWSHYPTMVLYLVQRHLPDVATSVSFTAYDIVWRYRLTAPVAQRADYLRTLAHVTVPQIGANFGVPAERLDIIYDAVDLELVPPPGERRPRSVVTAGRLIDTKGMDHVVRVFAAVHERWPDATLRVLGAGPNLGKLRALAAELGVADAVTFVGHVAQRDVLAEMRRAEVFLFLSEMESERLPNVVKEAMVCGCVCVVSDTVGIEELVAHGESGYVVRRGGASDAEAFGRAVDHVDDLFAGRVRAADLTTAAEATIRRSFDLRATIGRYLEGWSEAVRRRRERRHGRS